MALQDVCSFHSASLFSPWNAVLLSSVSSENSVHMFGRGFGEDSNSRRWYRNSSSTPLEFYVPVLEYLAESPIEFGQIHPSCNAPRAIPEPNNHLDPFPSPSVSPSIPLPFPLGHGTTTLGFVFQGGVIAAADSRSSCSGLVACPASQKILPVHSHLVGTTSGTSADCALWKRVLARELRLYQLRHRRRLSTGGAAKLLSHMLHPFKGTELCVAATLCGWDGEEEGSPDGRTGTDEERVTRAEKHGNARERTQPSVKSGSTSQPTVASDGNSESVKISHARCQPIGKSATSDQPTGRDTASSTLPASKQSGPSLYYVCSDGLRLQGALFSVGSGSPYAYSVLDGRVHWALGVDEAVSLAREAVYRATHRDAYSGNNVDLYHVTAKGWRRRPREDLKEEYYREKEEERRRKERGRREDQHKVGHVEEMLKMTG